MAEDIYDKETSPLNETRTSGNDTESPPEVDGSTDRTRTMPQTEEVERTRMTARASQDECTAQRAQSAKPAHAAPAGATTRIDPGTTVDPTVQAPTAQPSERKPGLFDGLSVAQIVAAAAAGATSMALSSTIGFGGSIINAAVSSVITVVCSQVYRHVLDASAEKVKEGIDSIGGSRDGSEAAATTTLDARDVAATTQTDAMAGETVQGTRVAPEELRESMDTREAEKRSATQKKVIIFSIVLAAIAVVVCAVLILAGTGGEGIGEKTEGIDLTEVVETADDATEEDEAEKDAESEDEDATDSEQSGAGTEDGSSGGKTSSSSSSSQSSSSNSSASSSSGSSDATSSDTEDESATENATDGSEESDMGASDDTGSSEDVDASGGGVTDEE